MMDAQELELAAIDGKKWSIKQNTINYLISRNKPLDCHLSESQIRVQGDLVLYLKMTIKAGLVCLFGRFLL